MTNKLVVIINGLKVPKIKKILLYEMKFLVPNYSCLQNPWLGGCHPPRSPFSLSSVLNWICWTPLPSPPEQNSWVRHWWLYSKHNGFSLNKKKISFLGGVNKTFRSTRLIDCDVYLYSSLVLESTENVPISTVFRAILETHFVSFDNTGQQISKKFLYLWWICY